MNDEQETGYLYALPSTCRSWILRRGNTVHLRDDGTNVGEQGDDNNGPPCLPAVLEIMGETMVK